MAFLENKRYVACRCGDSRLAVKTNHNFLFKCGQCKQKWRGPLCSNCGFHCCLQCRKINQMKWKETVSKLSHWNNNALKQQERYKQILQSIPQIFILYNDKQLVQTLCDHIYNTRNKEILSIFADTIDDDKFLLNAFYPKFEAAIISCDIFELKYLKKMNIITRKYVYEFRKKNGINILHHVCTINISTNNIKNHIEIINIIMELIVKYKLLHRNIYDIISIFEFSTYCSDKQHQKQIINILDTFINNEIKERGLKKWIDGYSLRRLPLYNYVSWRYCSKIPFCIIQWIVNNTIKYQIMPYFLNKYKQKHNDINNRQRSLSYGHLPRYYNKQNTDEHKEQLQRTHSVKFKTYNRILYPLLVMESHYISQRSIIYEWMKYFIEMDSEIVLFKSCEKHSFPVNDAMTLNSNMVGTIMNLCKEELYQHYSLHCFIDIACLNPKIEYRVLQWIQICLEKYEKRLLFKNIKHLSPLQYAQKHQNYYCSQIVLFLKRKLQSAMHQKEQKDEDESVIDKLQKEILQLKQENTEWKDKYLKLHQQYEALLNSNKKRNSVHIYPTPKAPKPMIKKNNDIDECSDNEMNDFMTKHYRDWNCNDIVYWIMSLKVKYWKYENILKSNIIKENIRGTHLAKLDRNDLSRLGINEFEDKYDIIEQIEILLSKHNEEIQKEGDNSNGYMLQNEGNDIAHYYPSPIGHPSFN